MFKSASDEPYIIIFTETQASKLGYRQIKEGKSIVWFTSRMSSIQPNHTTRTSSYFLYKSSYIELVGELSLLNFSWGASRSCLHLQLQISHLGKLYSDFQLLAYDCLEFDEEAKLKYETEKYKLRRAWHITLDGEFNLYVWKNNRMWSESFGESWGRERRGLTF